MLIPLIIALAALQPVGAQEWVSNLEEDGRPAVTPGLRGLKAKDVIESDDHDDDATKEASKEDVIVTDDPKDESEADSDKDESKDDATKEASKEDVIVADDSKDETEAESSKDESKDASDKDESKEGSSSKAESETEESKDESDKAESKDDSSSKADSDKDESKDEPDKEESKGSSSSKAESDKDENEAAESDKDENASAGRSGKGQAAKAAHGRSGKGQAAKAAHDEKEKEKKEEAIEQHIIRDDLVQKLVRPSRLMPFYLLPVAGSFKILVQFVILGSDLKMSPVNPDPGFSGLALKWGAHVMGTLPFIILAYNSFRLDAKALKEVGDLIPEAYDNHLIRIVSRMVVLITSSNFIAAIGVWAGIMAQSPKSSLDLKAKYCSIPFLRGFPLNPFGTEWLLPLKWLYAMLLMPYAVWALPGYFVITYIQSSLSCSLCCCAGFGGCCSYIMQALKMECCCLWNCIKCNFWTIMALVTFGFWAKAKSEFIAFWPFIWTFGYYFLLIVWTQIVPFIFTTIYAGLIGAGLDAIAYAPLSSANAEEMSDEAKQQLLYDQVVWTSCSLCMPQAVMPTPLSPDLRVTLRTFNAANLSKDFEIDQDFLSKQKEAYAAKGAHHEVDKAKLATLKSILLAGGQVVATQVVFLTLLRTSVWMQAAYHSDDKWTAVTRLDEFLGQAYYLTLSERHWYTYADFVTSTAHMGMTALSSNLPAVLDAFWTLF